MKTVYLDHAAATPVDDRVLAAMQPYWSDKFHNPSALYGAAKAVHDDVEAARRSVAQVLGVRPAEIIFTAGGTEANNLAISGIVQCFPGSKFAVSAIEHDSVLATAEHYGHVQIPVNGQGIAEPEAVRAIIDDSTVLVSLMYANNEIGTIQPIREVGRLIDELRRERRARGVDLPLYFHTDAAQAANYLDLHPARLGVDLMTLNGGKIYGPKQSGVLYVRAGTELSPVIFGGGQERGLRSGTENVPAIVGFARALELASEMRAEETRRLQELQKYFFDRLAVEMPEAIINGSLRKRLPNNLHFTLPGTDNERLLFQLDEAGIMAAAGSACSASSEAPSHVLEAMGLSEAAARSSLRLTMGRATAREDLDYVLATLRRI